MTFADEEKRIKGAFIALERSEERGGGRKRRSTMELHQWMLRRRAERMHSSRAPKKKGTRHAGAKREFYCYLGNMCQKYGKYGERYDLRDTKLPLKVSPIWRRFAK